MEDEQMWDPERLRIIGSVLSRYSTYLQPGDHIRLGMEGDPCTIYRSVAEAPVATVLDVQRKCDGLVQFRAQFRGSEQTFDLDNRSVSPDRIWEIDPDYIDVFRDRVEQQLNQQAKTEANDEEVSKHDKSAEFRGMKNSLESLQKEIAALRDEGTEFRSTMASAVRELAGDLFRASNGESLQFASQYADRYDSVVSEEPTPIKSSFRSSHQKEKYDYVPEVSYGNVKESDELSEDGKEGR